MDFIYIDEKGTQETIDVLGKKSTAYKDEQKIELGSDYMKDFVATAIKVSKENHEELENEYNKIENKYKKGKRGIQKFKDKNRELKGTDILFRNTTTGISSMEEESVEFYLDLIDILNDKEISSHVFTVNKIALVIDKRFKEWAFKLGERNYINSTYLLMYTLIKYVDIEANQIVVEELFNKDKKNKEVLNLIEKDIQNFISKHKGFRYQDRLKQQINSYEYILNIIKKYKMHLVDIVFKIDGDKFIKLNWEKAVFNLDLWLIELNNNSNQTELFLDEGIKKEHFRKLNLSKVHENMKSHEYVGLRIADVLVALVGNCMSKLSKEIFYDKDNPYKKKMISNQWFELNEKQFYLVKKLYEYKVESSTQYGFTNDLYFDNTTNFLVYLESIATYTSYDKYKAVDSSTHSKDYLELAIIRMKEKFISMNDTEQKTIELYGSLSEAERQGIIRPF